MWSLDPRNAARALTSGVYQRLEKAITISVPSAVQVLESQRGDCKEHTVLYVALASLARATGPHRRGTGLPERSVLLPRLA